MPDIHIRREHRLGLVTAKKVARQWAEEATRDFGMECSLLEDESGAKMQFARTGVRGELLVEAKLFTLDASLGLLLGAFSKTIEAEIEKHLDALLARSAPGAGAARSTKPKPGAKRPASRG